MNDQKLSFAKTIENDWYALKLGFSISKSLVINSFFMRLAVYFEWVFFDAIFWGRLWARWMRTRALMRYLALLRSALWPDSIYQLCGQCDSSSADDQTVWGIYRKLFAKARNVELKCYEDSDFYNRYTMAMDGAEAKVSAIIRSLYGHALARLKT